MTDPTLFPCAQCGAALRFSPGAQALACDHCGHRHPISDAAHWGDDGAPELDYAAAVADGALDAPVEEVTRLSCPSCGASFRLEGDAHAGACPYCAEPAVVDTGAHRQFKPQAVLPFAVDAKAAQKRLSKWLEGLWFAPSDLSAYARAEKDLNGVYAPFWAFDADTASAYHGERGTVYYVTRSTTAMRNGKMVRVNKRVQKVRWRPASGRVSRRFDDVLALASRALPHKLAQRLSGMAAAWDLHDLRPYEPAYLSGFEAEAYTVDLEDGFHEARAVMDLQIRRDVRRAIGGDRQRIHEVRTDLSNVTFTHILLPVWAAAYRYRGKTYQFLINGRTGEVIGERPYSGWKIAVAALAAAALAAAVYFGVAMLEGL